MKRKPNKVPKARNPSIAAMRFRKSGVHYKTNKAKRRGAKVAFQQLKATKEETNI